MPVQKTVITNHRIENTSHNTYTKPETKNVSPSGRKLREGGLRHILCSTIETMSTLNKASILRNIVDKTDRHRTITGSQDGITLE